MKQLNTLLLSTMIFFMIGCSMTKNTTAPTAPPQQRVPAKFDYSPQSRAQTGSTGITIAIVKPTYVGKNPEYFVPPFNEMASRMGNDFEELLTAKGFTMKGPYGSRDEMVYIDKINSSFVMEIGIELNPQYNRKYSTAEHAPSFSEILLNKNAPTTYTYKMSGEVTLGGSLVINVRSAQYGELLWKKSIELETSSFTYEGQNAWSSVPTMADELNKDNVVYNTVSRELEKLYNKTLNLAWQQIDPAEMKGVAEQGKKADKKGN